MQISINNQGEAIKENTKENSEKQGGIPQSDINIKTDLEKQRKMENETQENRS